MRHVLLVAVLLLIAATADAQVRHRRDTGNADLNAAIAACDRHPGVQGWAPGWESCAKIEALYGASKAGQDEAAAAAADAAGQAAAARLLAK